VPLGHFHCLRRPCFRHSPTNAGADEFHKNSSVEQETVQAIGLVVPPSLPDRADEVDRMTICVKVFGLQAMSCFSPESATKADARQRL
jgi:hypothetical protein